MSSPDISSNSGQYTSYTPGQNADGTVTGDATATGEVQAKGGSKHLEHIKNVSESSIEDWSAAKGTSGKSTAPMSSQPDAPGMPAPKANASTNPMSAAGGNPWGEASGFVAMIMALAVVAGVLARNALADNKAVVQGQSAQYEEGVEAGKMARDAKYAEAMADIVGGIGQLITAGVGIAMAGAMAAHGAKSVEGGESPQSRAAQARQDEMDAHVSNPEELVATKQEVLDKKEADLKALEKSNPEDAKAIQAKRDERDAAQADLDSATRLQRAGDEKAKAKALEELAETDSKYGALKQSRDKSRMEHESTRATKIQNDRQMINLVGDSAKSTVGGIGQMAQAPFKMIEGNYQMQQQIFQTASQIMGNFVSAMMNDMQSANQMIDALNQLQQKATDENTRAMSSHA